PLWVTITNTAIAATASRTPISSANLRPGPPWLVARPRGGGVGRRAPGAAPERIWTGGRAGASGRPGAAGAGTLPSRRPPLAPPAAVAGATGLADRSLTAAEAAIARAPCAGA